MKKRMISLFVLLVLCLAVHAPPASPAEPDAAGEARMKKLMDRIFTGATSSRISYDPRPNAFLVDSVQEMKPGTALDVGMGQGRNAVYLARRGWRVTGFDISPTAVKMARAEAEKAGVSFKAIESSDAQFDFGNEQWDLIVLSYVDFRHLLDRIWKGLKPGGHVVIEYYHRDTRRYRPLSDNKSFASNELLKIFDRYRIIRYDDVAARPDWIFTGNEKHRVVRLLAQKGNKGAPKVCYEGAKTFLPGEETCRDRKKLRCEETGWMHRGACK